MASRRESLPENGSFAVLRALPEYAPWTCTVGLIVLTLFAVPATGDSTAVTDPFCTARPDRGSGFACVLCDWFARDAPWAKPRVAITNVPKQRIAAVPPIRTIGAVIVLLSFISRPLIPN